VSWSIATFLVLPIVIVDGCGPVVALRRAVPLVAETWSEQVMGLVIFGWLVTLVAVPTVPVWGIYLITWGTYPPSPFVWAASLWMLALSSTITMATHSAFAAAYGHRTIELCDGVIRREYTRPAEPPLHLVDRS
jgi:Family of unknown function (DUF6159)